MFKPNLSSHYTRCSSNQLTIITNKLIEWVKITASLFEPDVVLTMLCACHTTPKQAVLFACLSSGWPQQQVDSLVARREVFPKDPAMHHRIGSQNKDFATFRSLSGALPTETRRRQITANFTKFQCEFFYANFRLNALIFTKSQARSNCKR